MPKSYVTAHVIRADSAFVDTRMNLALTKPWHQRLPNPSTK